MSKQELQAVELEYNHFKRDQIFEITSFNSANYLSSTRLLNLWLQFQAYAEKDVIVPKEWWNKCLAALQWWWMNLIGRYVLKLNSKFDKHNLSAIITELQTLYYHRKIEELNERITNLQAELKTYNAKTELNRLTEVSMQLFKASLFKKYGKEKRKFFSSVRDLRIDYQSVLEQYPVVLSTTFSSRICLSDQAEFDYLIMDEASQVSIETGALALTCAKMLLLWEILCSCPI